MKALQGYGLIAIDGAEDILVKTILPDHRGGTVFLRFTVVGSGDERSEIMICLRDSDRARDLASRLASSAQKEEADG